MVERGAFAFVGNEEIFECGRFTGGHCPARTTVFVGGEFSADRVISLRELSGDDAAFVPDDQHPGIGFLECG